jgi:hypothetical protein
MNMEPSIDGTYQHKLVNMEELAGITDFCYVVHFEDNEGSQYPPGSSPRIVLSDEISPPAQIYLNGEIEKDKLGRLRYTGITYLTDGEVYPLDKILPAVNKLIDCYRLVSDEYWLDRVIEEDIISTSNIDSRTRSGGFTYRPVIKAKPDIDEEKLRAINDLIGGNRSIPTFQLLLLDARKALDEGNYALSIIYGITALESVVKQYLEKIATQRGLSKKTFGNMGLSTLVTVILRMTLDKMELPDQLINGFKEANKKRNDIIHQAALDTDRNDAVKSLESVNQLVELLAKYLR